MWIPFGARVAISVLGGPVGWVGLGINDSVEGIRFVTRIIKSVHKDIKTAEADGVVDATIVEIDN